MLIGCIKCIFVSFSVDKIFHIHIHVFTLVSDIFWMWYVRYSFLCNNQFIFIVLVSKKGGFSFEIIISGQPNRFIHFFISLFFFPQFIQKKVEVRLRESFLFFHFIVPTLRKAFSLQFIFIQNRNCLIQMMIYRHGTAEIDALIHRYCISFVNNKNIQLLIQAEKTHKYSVRNVAITNKKE